MLPAAPAKTSWRQIFAWEVYPGGPPVEGKQYEFTHDMRLLQRESIHAGFAGHLVVVTNVRFAHPRYVTVLSVTGPTDYLEDYRENTEDLDDDDPTKRFPEWYIPLDNWRDFLYEIEQ